MERENQARVRPVLTGLRVEVLLSLIDPRLEVLTWPEETAHTAWLWLKVQGKLSLESDETSGIFTMTYESRR